MRCLDLDYYTIQDVADKLKISKQAIYVKLKLPMFKNKMPKKHGKTYINEDLFNLIENSLKSNNYNFKKEAINNDIENEVAVESSQGEPDLVNYDKNLISTLINQLKEKDNQLNIKDNQLKEKDDQLSMKDKQLNTKDNQLENQLNIKDGQIGNLNERLKQSLELNKNSQILQLKQPQDIKLLEEHFQELDTKLEEVKNKMSGRKDKQEHKSIFSKMFKGND